MGNNGELIDQAKSRACAVVDRIATDLVDASHAIHSCPELGYAEHFASERLADLRRLWRDRLASTEPARANGPAEPVRLEEGHRIAAPSRRAVAMAWSPATPAPITSTFAGGTVSITLSGISSAIS